MTAHSGVVDGEVAPPRSDAPEMSLAARLPLVAVLVIAFQLEMILNRVGARLLHRDLLAPPGWLRNTVDVAGLFVFYFAGALAVLVVTFGLLRILIFSSTIPRGARGAMSALGVAFVPLLLVGLWLRLPGPLHLYLQASFTGLAVMLTLGGVLGRAGARAKVGMILVAVPLVLHLAAAIVLARNPTAVELSHTLLFSGEVAVLIAAIAAVVLLSPTPLEARRARRGGSAAWWLPGLLGLLVGGGGVLLAELSWEMAARVAAYGFGLELPIPALGVSIFGVALAAWATVVTRLLQVPGSARLRGYGLLLLGLAGFQLDQPGQLAAVLVGLMAILVSFEPEPTADPDEWNAVIEQIAVIVGAAHVQMSGGIGDEEARMRFQRAGQPGDGETVELSVARRRGALYLVEVVHGVAPAGAAPPLSLTRRGTDRLGKSDGAIVSTGDVAFDEAFRVNDARDVHGPDPILDDETRAALTGSVEGWLGIWPGQGVRYRSRRARFVDQLLGGHPETRATLLALVDLLVRLRLR